MSTDAFAFSMDDLPEEIRQELLRQLKGARKKFKSVGDHDFQREMGFASTEIKQMSENEADDLLEQWLNHQINEGTPDGFEFSIKVTRRGLCHAILNMLENDMTAVAHNTPDYIRDAVTTDFTNRLMEQGADKVTIEWENVRYVPNVRWMYKDQGHMGIFHLNGKCIQGYTYEIPQHLKDKVSIDEIVKVAHDNPGGMGDPTL